MERECKKSSRRGVLGSASVLRGVEGVEKREGVAEADGVGGGIPKELTAVEVILSAVVPRVR
jgi:hypothetical protein